MRTALLLSVAALSALALTGCSNASAADPLTGTRWQLRGIDSMADPREEQPTVIDDPAKYTVEFGSDGRVAFRVDCNRGSATWQVEPAAPDSGGLTFGPIALTRMFCPQPSADTKVAAALAQVRSYLLSDGELHLSMEADSGVMHWRPVAG